MHDRLRFGRGSARFLVFAAWVFVSGCAFHPPAETPANDPGKISHRLAGSLVGYLSNDERPDSLKLLPPPPVDGSAAFALDRQTARDAAALRNSPRWRQAIEDANLLPFSRAANTFSCALDAPVTQKSTPHLYNLLLRSMVDAGLSTYAAKNRYQRPRPFMIDGTPMCTPDERDDLVEDGSYPSGHSAVGWAWALILTEIAPEHSNALLARGLAFTESRIVCNVHWRSDVEEGRIMGAATVARLHANATFQADLAQARAELAAIRERGDKPERDCGAEAMALAPPKRSPKP